MRHLAPQHGLISPWRDGRGCFGASDEQTIPYVSIMVVSHANMRLITESRDEDENENDDDDDDEGEEKQDGSRYQVRSSYVCKLAAQVRPCRGGSDHVRGRGKSTTPVFKGLTFIFFARR